MGSKNIIKPIVSAVKNVMSKRNITCISGTGVSLSTGLFTYGTHITEW
jgi:NAD-dependent SIR2 family protein deacetylase